MKTKYSPVTLITFGVLSLVGLVYGYFLYLHAPETYPPNDPASNAIAIHLGLAAFAIVLVFVVQLYSSRKHLRSIWLAPFSAHAFQRLKATFAPPYTVGSILRMLACLLPLFFVLWTPFRSSMQVTAAFDPSVTSNAWGGPSYIGATLAHWMDGAILLYVGALLLHWFMKKR